MFRKHKLSDSDARPRRIARNKRQKMISQEGIPSDSSLQLSQARVRPLPEILGVTNDVEEDPSAFPKPSDLTSNTGSLSRTPQFSSGSGCSPRDTGVCTRRDPIESVPQTNIAGLQPPPDSGYDSAAHKPDPSLELSPQAKPTHLSDASDPEILANKAGFHHLGQPYEVRPPPGLSDRHNTVAYQANQRETIDPVPRIPRGFEHLLQNSPSQSKLGYHTNNAAPRLPPGFEGVIKDRVQKELLWASGRGEFEQIFQRLDSGCFNIDIQDSYGMSPLMVASGDGYFEAVKVMIDHYHANIYLETKGGETAMSRALMAGYDEIFVYLARKINPERFGTRRETFRNAVLTTLYFAEVGLREKPSTECIHGMKRLLNGDRIIFRLDEMELRDQIDAHRHNIRFGQISYIPVQFAKLFELGKALGSGSFGAVFECFWRYNGSKMAVKVSYEPIWRGRRSIERDMLEIIKRHGNHENVISLRLAIEDSISHGAFLIMDLANRGTLFQNIDTLGGLKRELVKPWFVQIMKGVEFLHSHNIAHRDIKPENILIFEERGVWTIKLADLGNSTQLKGSHNGTTHDWPGTRVYMAPEAILLVSGELGRDDVIEAKPADIWAAGVVLYAMITGEFPFDDIEDDEFMVAQLRAGLRFDRLKDLAEICRDDESLYNLCLEMMDLDYMERPAAERCLLSMVGWN